MKAPSHPTYRFDATEDAEIQRSSFDRSRTHKTTFDAGLVIPVYLDEVLPGDTHTVRMQGFARMATPIYPIMDNLKIDTHFFFVPTRLVWDNWEKFLGAQDDPGDSIDYTIPVMSVDVAYTENSIFDYLGLPVGETGYEHSALPLRAYNLIWNEWFRDQNINNSLNVLTDDGPDGAGNYTVRRRNKRHDYFTSAAPSPQRGESIPLPIGTEAPVLGIGETAQAYTRTPTGVMEADGTLTAYTDASLVGTDGNWYIESLEVPGGGDRYPYIRADLANATGATINQLRQAYQVQRMLERDMRGGTRIPEVLWAHFRVRSDDARLQRPEFLGGGTSHVTVSPIAATVPSVSGPLGTLAGIGVSNLNQHGFSKSFTEWGYIIGVVSVRADLTYQQGLDRLWSRQTRYDFFWPALAHLGEQAVLTKEIYCDGSSTDDDVFGYQERYAEYRYSRSLVTGTFRSSAAAPLDAWHLSQDFGAAPVLNSVFIREDPPMDRVLAVTDEPQFIFDSLFNVRSVRPLPVYGTPGMIDHF